MVSPLSVPCGCVPGSRGAGQPFHQRADLYGVVRRRLSLRPIRRRQRKYLGLLFRRSGPWYLLHGWARALPAHVLCTRANVVLTLLLTCALLDVQFNPTGATESAGSLANLGFSKAQGAQVSAVRGL